MRPPPRPHAAALVPALVAAACTPLPTPRPPPPVRIVVTERWAQGGRLVVVDDAGDRVAVLVPPPPGPPATVRDEQAAFSPDGRWLAFVSTRDRTDGRTSLWLIEAAVGAVAVRLTADDRADDVSPTWTPDGAALVFASDRAGSFDLYRLDLDLDLRRARPRGAPARLTDAPGHEVAPTIAADGRIVAQVIEPGLAARSYLAEVGAGGALTPLTDGPLDATPAWAPDGRRLAYVTRRLRAGGGEDAELVVLDTARDRPPSPVTELPDTDESGPVWSADGRWLFATSVLLDDAEQPLWSSVIAVDLREARFVPRMLRDQVGAIVRAGPALAPVRLDELALLRAPAYLPALTQALRELEEVETRAANEPR